MHTKTVAEDEVRKGIERGLDAVILIRPMSSAAMIVITGPRLIQLAAKGELPRIPPEAAHFATVAKLRELTLRLLPRGTKAKTICLPAPMPLVQEVVATAGQLAGPEGRDPHCFGNRFLRMGAAVLNLVFALHRQRNR